MVLGLGGSLAVRGTITVGAFVAFGFYLGMLTWPLIALGWVVNLFQRGAASMARLLDVLDAEPQIRSPAAPVALPAATGGRTLEFRDVGFHFPAHEGHEPRWVLRHVSFTVPAGETLAVVGATGSGKSALIDLIPRIADPQEGEILLDGVPVRSLSLEALRRRDRIRAAGELSVQRHDRREPRLRRRGASARGARWRGRACARRLARHRRPRRRAASLGRRGGAARRDGARVPAWIRDRARRARDQPLGRTEAARSRWPVRSRGVRASSCSTTRCRPWTRTRKRRSCTGCAARSPGARR